MASNATLGQFNVIPMSDIQVLSQEISDEQGSYRIRAGRRVHYLTIPVCDGDGCIFDETTLCRPYLLIPRLPPFPDTDWTTMHLFRRSDGVLDSVISFEPLAQIESDWHSQHLDVLSLKVTKYHKMCVREVEFHEKDAISKVAVQPWLIPQIEHETRMYEALARLQHPDKTSLTPTFLGHLFEGVRNVGFLLEKVEGKVPIVADLPKCEAALRRLHDMGFLHGDPVPYNFIVEQTTGHVKIIDLEHAEPYDEVKAAAEIEELEREMKSNSGRGAPVTFAY